MREQIREYIEHLIPVLYRDHLSKLSPMFPLNPKIVSTVLLPRACRLVSYQNLAAAQRVTVPEIINLFGSEDGCTHYDRKNHRYLIAYNADGYRPRIRWTIAHELGHILCGHFVELDERGLTEVPEELWQEMEEEADYFTASLLAPIPAIRKFRTASPMEISRYFGLSGAASRHRWEEYVRREVECESTDDAFDGVRFTIHPSLRRKPVYLSQYRSDTELLYEEQSV